MIFAAPSTISRLAGQGDSAAPGSSAAKVTRGNCVKTAWYRAGPGVVREAFHNMAGYFDNGGLAWVTSVSNQGDKLLYPVSGKAAVSCLIIRFERDFECPLSQGF